MGLPNRQRPGKSAQKRPTPIRKIINRQAKRKLRAASEGKKFDASHSGYTEKAGRIGRRIE